MFLYVHLGCDNWWKEFERHCYKFFSEFATWSDARDDCLRQDSFLASIHSWGEQAFVGSIITSSSFDVWIGGKMGTFDFEWEDGGEFDYTNWYPNQPDHSGECIFMSSYSSYQWNDYSCTYQNRYVCKKSYTK